MLIYTYYYYHVITTNCPTNVSNNDDNDNSFYLYTFTHCKPFTYLFLSLTTIMPMSFLRKNSKVGKFHMQEDVHSCVIYNDEKIKI